jgi:hypothetical protein
MLHGAPASAGALFMSPALADSVAKMLNSTEDAHMKTMSTFEIDEHFRYPQNPVSPRAGSL